MNTPKTKKPKRYSRAAQSTRQEKYKRRSFGILDPEVAATFGFMLSYWTRVEEEIISLFDELIRGAQSNNSPDHTNARLMFYSIINQRVRITLMRALLEGAPQNVTKPQLFDALLDDFNTLNGIRNDYVHGLWWTSEGDVLFAAPSADQTDYIAPRIVTADEFHEVSNRMGDLVTAIHTRNQPQGSP